jgi:hypothetical protein
MVQYYTQIGGMQGEAERAVRGRPTERNGDFDVTMPPKKAVTSVLKKAERPSITAAFIRT